jgi:hypothetical protein
VNSAVFSVEYDHTWLSFDPLNPEAISFEVPAGFMTAASVGTNGQIDIVIYASEPELTLLDGIIANITLNVGQPDDSGLAPVSFFYAPPVSLGSTAGESILVTPENGSVWVYNLTRHFFLPFTVVAP